MRAFNLTHGIFHFIDLANTRMFVGYGFDQHIGRFNMTWQTLDQERFDVDFLITSRHLLQLHRKQ
ncbi:Uncharacterised protein [Vibrio cholerae]|nr:Uncharacterised protein [Vibrio cholerae]CSC56978.1 Uncharacterised protein [Vibrio cholerae]